VRRFTLITLIVLFILIAVAAAFQILAARRDVLYPGPGRGTFFPPTPTASAS
jgi:hypothetical protein